MEVFDALSATWPAAETVRQGPWTLRRGDGGGNRVSAATLDGPMGDIATAEAGMRGWGQRPQFSVRPEQTELDAALAERGYVAADHSVLMAAPARDVALPAPDERAIDCAGPLACMVELWAADGVGRARLAVMERAPHPKTWLMGRSGDRAVACGFVSMAGDVAMLHALTVAHGARRSGLGPLLTQAAAHWAGLRGAGMLALAVTERNTGARALYAGLRMREVGRYHYRMSQEA